MSPDHSEEMELSSEGASGKSSSTVHERRSVFHDSSDRVRVLASEYVPIQAASKNSLRIARQVLLT